MTAEKAFTTIILFGILQFPLRALPESITQLTQIWVSLKRIGKFLYTSEIDRYYIVKGTQSDNAIEIRDGSFYWDLEKK
jgi:ABC-type multidrug transport system fused ATPase/permease subunit